jgi:hypothetical protein
VRIDGHTRPVVGVRWDTSGSGPTRVDQYAHGPAHNPGAMGLRGRSCIPIFLQREFRYPEEAADFLPPRPLTTQQASAIYVNVINIDMTPTRRRSRLRCMR